MNSLNKTTTHSLVMLIDDSSIDNFVNQRMISRYQFADKVLEFTRTKDSLKFLMGLNNDLSKTVPGVIFLDLEMPEIDGLEFLDTFNLLPERIRNNINIVILTNSFNPEHIQKVKKNSSVLTYLYKPLMKSNFDLIEKMISKKNSKLVKC